MYLKYHRCTQSNFASLYEYSTVATIFYRILLGVVNFASLTAGIHIHRIVTATTEIEK